MGITILSKENIKELPNKEILIYFDSELGAMGCPGLDFILFIDGSVYAYSKIMDDYKIINECANRLLFSNAEKNISFINEYLGMGNSSFINKKIYDEYKSLIKNNRRYIAFRGIVKKYSKYDVFDIYDYLLIK